MQIRIYNFKPGGGGPGGSSIGPNSSGFSSSSSSIDYAIYIYGGAVYVNAEGDGLDSNGDIYIYGGALEVWGMCAGGDNEPIDHDGDLIISDATIFAGGTQGLEYLHKGIKSINQNYQYSIASVSAGDTIYVTGSDGDIVYYALVPKNINYMFYTAPSGSGYSFSTSGTADCAVGNSWSHTWDDGVITTEATEDSDGVITYTCSVCGTEETQTYHYTSDSGEDNEEDEGEGETTVYTAVFEGDDGVSGIDIYYTQDYTTADETDVTQAYARDSDTGEILSDGDGQINFLVKLEDGYAISAVDVSGDYNKIKDSTDTGVENLYRITKVNGDLTVTITTEYTGEETDVESHVHTLSDAVVENEIPATCTEEGSYESVIYCAVCKEEISRETVTVAAVDHTWDSGEITKEATCTTAGVKTYTCSSCGATREESIAATGHSYDSGKVTKAATCTTAGVKTYTCSSCGDPYTESISATGHNYDSGKVTTIATCTAAGIMTYTCSSCGATKEESIAATGHSWDSGTVTTVATYDSTGVMTYTCKSCGATKAENIPQLTASEGSSYSDSTATYKITAASGNTNTVTVTAISDKSLTKVTIPDTVTIGGTSYKVTKIAASAFANCTKLKTVSIGSNVTSIGSKAFCKCTALTKITIGSGVTSIGKKAFYGCTKLKTVSGCAGVKTIGASAFYNCKVLTTVKGCTAVTSVGSKAFYKCVKLTRIGSRKNVITLAKVKTIGSSAFYGCTAIKKVNLTSTALTTIGASAFRGCTALTTFTSESTKLKSIGRTAFYGDKKLATVTLKTSKLTSSNVKANAFKGIKSTCTFKVPSKKVSVYKKIFKARGAGSKITVKKG